MRARRSRVAVSTALVLSILLVALAALTALRGPRAGAVDPASIAAADAAVAWIVTQQQPDGGFEVAGFPGFETPDAVLAIAEAAQSAPPGTGWSTTEALSAVSGLHVGGSGPTPLDALDDFVDGGITAGQAAKLVVLVVAPLGLDLTDFDPSEDTGPAVDLAAIVDPAGCAGDPSSFGFFNQTLYGALAKKLLCGAPNPAVLTTIRAGQRGDGGWNFLGDLDPGTDSDVDTTALAVQALVAGGAAWNDPAITKALAFLAAQQSASGAFPAFGSDDPNSTAVAMLAIAAAGFDPSTSCWRDTTAPERVGSAYADPAAWLRSQQQSNGRIASPNDGFGINTFATAQSVEGLLQSWLPIVRAGGAPTCAGASDAPAEPAPAVSLVPRFAG